MTDMPTTRPPAYLSWTGASRTMALDVDAAVTAAASADAGTFDDALGALAKDNREQLAVLLGAMTRDLLERTSPDGLDSDDVGQALTSCARWAAPWYEPFDATTLLAALAGALGVADPQDVPTDGPGVVAHGVLFIAHRLTSARLPLPEVLEAALGELRRAQTVEMP